MTRHQYKSTKEISIFLLQWTATTAAQLPLITFPGLHFHPWHPNSKRPNDDGPNSIELHQELLTSQTIPKCSKIPR